MDFLEFRTLMEEYHPEIIAGVQTMPMRQAIDTIAKRVGFRTILLTEMITDLLEELWLFI